MNKMNKRAAAEWYWIIIGIVIALIVAIFILVLFTDFGASIKNSFADIISLTKDIKLE